jgi:hypothetical protein
VDEFEDVTLIEDSGPTAECYRLAVEASQSEAEIRENVGYRLLRDVCSRRNDSQAFYGKWRRLTIERPVLTVDEIWKFPSLIDARLKDLIDTFYQEVPEPLAIDGRLPICTFSGTILRRIQRAGKGWETECRDPGARRSAKRGDCEWMKYRPGVWQLRRPFRIFWCLPGKTELALEKRFKIGGWQCELWPNFDEVDLVAEKAGQKQKLAVDVKDYSSPVTLARTFTGFGDFELSHRCIVVVPDHVAKVVPGFQRRFREKRASLQKAPIELLTISDLTKGLHLS